MITGPSAFALGLALGFYTPARTELWVGALVLSGVALSFSCAPVASRRRLSDGGRVLVAAAPALCAAGILVGAVGALGAEAASGVRLGLREADIDSVEGRLGWDSGRVRGSRAYDLTLTSCAGSGVEATASGRVRILAKDGSKGYWGETVSFAGVRPGRGGLWYADEAHVVGTRQAALGKRADWHRAHLPEREGISDGRALYLALVAGIRDDVDPGVVELFRRSGCSHLLALSGMHLGMLCAIPALVLGKRIGPRRAALVSTGLAAAYVLFVGPKPSLVRAVVMYSIAAGFFFRDVKTSGLSVLSLAFLVLTLGFPDIAQSLSFQLSLLALLGILAFAPAAGRYLSRYLPPSLSSGVAAAFGAQFATAGLVASTFGVIYPVGVVASIVLLPAVVAHVVAGAAVGIGESIGVLPTAAGEAALSVTHHVVRRIAGVFAAAPNVAVTGSAAWALLGVPLSVFAAVRLVGRRWRAA